VKLLIEHKSASDELLEAVVRLELDHTVLKYMPFSDALDFKFPRHSIVFPLG